MRLAATGLSNREIGEALFLSPRTVGTHLHHAFPKLGVTTRGRLRDVVDDLGRASATSRSGTRSPATPARPRASRRRWSASDRDPSISSNSVTPAFLAWRLYVAFEIACGTWWSSSPEITSIGPRSVGSCCRPSAPSAG